MCIFICSFVCSVICISIGISIGISIWNFIRILYVYILLDYDFYIHFIHNFISKTGVLFLLEGGGGIRWLRG